MILKSMKAQIGTLLISMNNDYLTLMNITIFDEVIYKYMDPTSSQFVVVALVRAGMVYGNKFLWEFLIFKKLWFFAQEQNWSKQKVNNKKRKLEKLQKPTEVQLDEAITDKVNAKIDSTVPNEVQTILAKTLTRKLFVSSKVQKQYSEAKYDVNSNETQGFGRVDQSGKKRKKRKNKKKNKNKSSGAAALEANTNTTLGMIVCYNHSSRSSDTTRIGYYLYFAPSKSDSTCP